VGGVSGLEVALDALGERDRELLERLLPVGDDLPLDEPAGRFPFSSGGAAFLGPVAGAFVFDVAD